jgi:hypothetical protein
MPTVVHQVMEMLAKETGWLFLVNGIGPNPTDDGRIYMRQYALQMRCLIHLLVIHRRFNFGGDEKLTCMELNSQFKEGFELPLIQYTNCCFCTY